MPAIWEGLGAPGNRRCGQGFPPRSTLKPRARGAELVRTTSIPSG